jgi:hypothetical protein
MANPGSNIRLGFRATSELMSELPNRYREKYEKGIGIAKPNIVPTAPFQDRGKTNALHGIDYGTLLDAFGEPALAARIGDTADATWYLQAGPDRIAIWNHKNGPAYLGEGDVRDINDWSVYASHPRAFDALVAYLQHYPEDAPGYE